MATPGGRSSVVAAEVVVAAPAAAPIAVAVSAPAAAATAVEFPSDHVHAASGEFSAMGMCNYSGTHPAISYGSKQSGAVAHAQVLLRNYHGYNTVVDRIFGNGTRNAVLNFQSGAGLYADGVIGAAIWEALHPGLD